MKETNINNKMKFDINVVFASGQEMKIFSTVFRELGKRYFQHQMVPVITRKNNEKLGFEVIINDMSIFGHLF